MAKNKETIRRASNKQVTTLRKLQQKKFRYQYHLFLVEGTRAVEQVLQNESIKTDALFFCQSSNEWKKKMWSSYSGRIPFFYLEDDDFGDITDSQNPQPVVAQCVMPDFSEVRVIAPLSGILIALDRIRDPGNIGTILRTAVWFGADALLVGSGSVDLFHPKVVRSTAGSIGSIAVAEGDLPYMLEELERNDWQVVLLEDRDEAMRLQDFSPGEKTILIIGNEADGIEKELHTGSRLSLRISGESGAESLNAAMAAGIALYEISKKNS